MVDVRSTSTKWLIFRCIAVVFLIRKAASVVVPTSNCYAIDNSSRLYDFTDCIGHVVEYEGKNSPDVVIHFCKDVVARSQQVILQPCKLLWGMWTMTTFLLQAILYQELVMLTLCSLSSLSGLVGKADVKVNPETGLLVKLSGSWANGGHPTTLSPAILILNWRCEKPRDFPYEVAVTIPVDGYDPIEFVLTKICDYKQDKEGSSLMGWATFGMLSCMLLLIRR